MQVPWDQYWFFYLPKSPLGKLEVIIVTYNKAFFVYFSGIFITFMIIFCTVAKLFFLKNLVCLMVLLQIGLLGYLVVITIFDIINEKKV